MEYLGQFSTFIAFAAFQQGTFEFNAETAAAARCQWLLLQKRLVLVVVLLLCDKPFTLCV